MALITCPECGKANVSDGAQACPDCGFGIKDHFLKIEREREAAAQAERKALEKAAKEEKEKKEREDRLEKVKMPEPPKKPVAMVTCMLVIGIMWLVLAFVDGFHLLWFGGGLFFCIVALAGISSYNDEVKKYEIAQNDFRKYQELIVKEEDIKQAVAARETQRKAAQALAIPKCPKCGSTYISTVNRGYSLVWGFIGSGNAMNVCQKCGYKFKPGK